LQLEHTSDQWRISVDLSKVTLKAVLIHKGNKYPGLLAHAVHRKETQTEPLGLTAKICYEEHW